MTSAILSMQHAVSLMRAAVDALCPPVPAPATATDAGLDAIDDALAEAFQTEPEEPELQACAWCGALSEERLCSAACRAAESYDGQHREER